MANFTFKCDFSDVAKAFDDFNRKVREEVEKTGKEAVNYAIENGSYHDVTGHLRASNRYEVKQNNSLVLVNDADYASDIEARGDDVLSGAYLFAEQQLKSKCR